MIAHAFQTIWKVFFIFLQHKIHVSNGEVFHLIRVFLYMIFILINCELNSKLSIFS